MARFFDPQNSFWQKIGQFADVLMLSVMWLFLSLPVFTLGAATAALYDATARCTLGGHANTVSRFWETFRRELKGSVLPTLIWGGLCALLIWGVWTLRGRVVFQGTTAVMVLAVWYVVLFLPVGVFCWMFPLLSRFTFSPGPLMVTALRLTLGYFPRTFVVVLVTLAAVVLSAWIWVPMLVAPGLAAIVWVKMMDGVFAKYTPHSPQRFSPDEEE